MLLTEYDEKAHMRGIYKEGEEAGYQKGKLEGYSKGEEDGYAKGERDGYRKGESDLLVKLVRQKLERGKSIPVIAEELETEAAVIEEIGERIKKHGQISVSREDHTSDQDSQLVFKNEDQLAAFIDSNYNLHDRKDLTPNVCAVYTEKEYHCKGITGSVKPETIEEIDYGQ